MTLPTNDDFSNRELSIEELEAIAAGGWFGSIVHAVEHAATVVWHDAGVAVHWIAANWTKFYPPHTPGGPGPVDA